MSERLPVIINPAARSARASGMVARVKALKPEPELHCTERPGHATEIAERLAREGRPIVVAAGGDGTVNEVLQGLCRANAERSDPASHTALGTLPAGTMNVFAYEIGFPTHKDIETPWRVITSGARRAMDLWMANDHYFIQLAGVGLDAEIVRQTTWEMKKKLGPLSYGLTGLRLLRESRASVRVCVPGQPERHGSVALIGNGRHYGGPFPLFRTAQPGDGLLDVVLVREPVNAWHLLQLLRGALADGYGPAEDVDYFQSADFTIEADPPTALQLDGEFAAETPVHFRRAPFPLMVAAA